MISYWYEKKKDTKLLYDSVLYKYKYKYKYKHDNNSLCRFLQSASQSLRGSFIKRRPFSKRIILIHSPVSFFLIEIPHFPCFYEYWLVLLGMAFLNWQNSIYISNSPRVFFLSLFFFLSFSVSRFFLLLF